MGCGDKLPARGIKMPLIRGTGCDEDVQQGKDDTTSLNLIMPNRGI